MKTQKKKDAKAPKREVVKANLSLGIEQYRRLFITSVMAGKSASSIVEELIDSGLKTWALPAELTNRSKGKDRATAPEEVSGNVEPLALAG